MLAVLKKSTILSKAFLTAPGNKSLKKQSLQTMQKPLNARELYKYLGKEAITVVSYYSTPLEFEPQTVSIISP